MKLDKNYSLKNDSNNWILNYKNTYKDENGKEITSKDKWYFPKLWMALEQYLNEKPKDAETIEELVAEIYKCKQIIAKWDK